MFVSPPFLPKPPGSANETSTLCHLARCRAAVRRIVALSIAVAGLVVLAGCASQAGLEPQAHLVSARAAGVPVVSGPDLQVQSSSLVDARWWQALGAPGLDALVERALADHPSLALAGTRIARAQALQNAAQASGGLQVQGAVDVTRQQYSANSLYPPPLGGSTKTLGTAQVIAAWEFDFFGRNRAAIAAAVGAERAAQAELQAARVVLASSVVRTYLQIGHRFALRAIAEQTLAQRQALLDLIAQRVQAGLDTVVEARQGEAALPDARQQIAQIDEQIMLARHALAVLTAQPPDALDTLVVTEAELRPMAFPSTVPADLLGRRADIVAARWRIEAALRDTDQARAQFYPNINLNAFVGLSSIGLGRLIQADSLQLGVGPAVRLPIFDSGRLRANLAVRNADLDAAIESYNGAVREAVREVQDPLASLRWLQQQQGEQARAQALVASAYDLVLQRYQAGLATYLTVLNAQSQLLAQRRLAADLAARVLDTQVALVRALGGGYGADAVADGRAPDARSIATPASAILGQRTPAP